MLNSSANGFVKKSEMASKEAVLEEVAKTRRDRAIDDLCLMLTVEYWLDES